MAGIDQKGATGTGGADGVVGTDGTPAGEGQKAACSGWFFVDDGPPSRGGNGGQG